MAELRKLRRRRRLPGESNIRPRWPRASGARTIRACSPSRRSTTPRCSSHHGVARALELDGSRAGPSGARRCGLPARRPCRRHNGLPVGRRSGGRGERALPLDDFGSRAPIIMRVVLAVDDQSSSPRPLASRRAGSRRALSHSASHCGYHTSAAVTQALSTVPVGVRIRSSQGSLCRAAALPAAQAGDERRP